MMKKISFLFILSFVLCGFVKAQSYHTSDDLTDNSVTEDIFNYAYSQIDDFIYKDYILLRNDNDYYLFSFKDNYKNSVVLHYTYNYNNSSYNIYNDNNVILNLNHLFLSNKKYDYSITSSYFLELYNSKYSILFNVLIVGLLFAIFLNRERKFV